MTKEHDELSLGFDPEFPWGEHTQLTALELKDLLRRSDNYIVEALRRTNSAGLKFMGELMGQEFGFIVFGDLTQQDRRLHFSPLYEGQENNINLAELSQPYLDDNPGLPHTGIFDFHSHTYLYLALLKKLQDPEVLEADDRETSYFSPRDLRSYFHLTRENPYYIRALGTERNGIGQVHLISFNNYQAWAFFNYEEVYEKSKKYIRAYKDPLNAYRESGLNVATIPVDLTRQSVLHPVYIDRASKILTTRFN